jgi:putative transposase
MRAAMNAIFYLLRTGCPWRYLPRDPFPPRSTVYNIFRKFQHEGVWERIWEELLVALREQRGREASPSATKARQAKLSMSANAPFPADGASSMR